MEEKNKQYLAFIEQVMASLVRFGNKLDEMNERLSKYSQSPGKMSEEQRQNYMLESTAFIIYVLGSQARSLYRKKKAETIANELALPLLTTITKTIFGLDSYEDKVSVRYSEYLSKVGEYFFSVKRIYPDDLMEIDDSAIGLYGQSISKLLGQTNYPEHHRAISFDFMDVLSELPIVSLLKSVK